jgi:hypothetical protein
MKRLILGVLALMVTWVIIQSLPDLARYMKISRM